MNRMGESDKLERLRQSILDKGRVLLAFSGGVDSGLLAKVAKDVLGDGAVPVIIDSDLLPRSEMRHAEAIAREMGLQLVVARLSPLDDPSIAANPPDRCYLCKKRVSAVLKGIARERGIGCIADGANLSDIDDYRPGIRATDEEGIWHPFIDAGMTKGDIRAISKQMGLSFWNRPASACLASRVPYGEKITREVLLKIEGAEEILKDLGISNVRARAHGDLVRIEVPEGDMEKVLDHRDEIVMGLRGFGFRYVSLDLEGYRTGSMNEALKEALVD